MTLIFQPVDLAISLTMVRITVSVPPPAPYITTTVIGRSGHSALEVLGKATNAVAQKTTAVKANFESFILNSLIICCWVYFDLV